MMGTTDAFDVSGAGRHRAGATSAAQLTTARQFDRFGQIQKNSANFNATLGSATMWRSLALVPLCLGIASALAAEQRRIASETMFCVNREDLLMFAIAKNTKEFKNRDNPGCSVLKKGQRYTVVDSGQGSTVKIRVHLPRRGTVEGYAVSPGE
jgi:hypothetical protein